MSDPIVITGFGVVTPIGVGAAAFERGLREGACGVGTIERFDASAYRSSVAFEVRDPVGTEHRAHVPFTSRYGRASAFALAALWGSRTRA